MTILQQKQTHFTSREQRILRGKKNNKGTEIHKTSIFIKTGI